MTKTYCDICGNELIDSNVLSKLDSSEVSKDGRWSGESISGAILVSVKWRGGMDRDVCKYCVIDGIIACDDRPKAAPMAPINEIQIQRIEGEHYRA